MRQNELAADHAARATALTALDRTLLVEAGAGSGKTSVLAGRVAALLAKGVEPRHIAAITFTELAAGELRARVVAFVEELAEGNVLPDLRPGFGPDGPTPEQRRYLVKARSMLDELTCTTIHGFCQRLLRPYPAEARMDPGAAVTDRDEADALRGEVLEEWLRERLSAPRGPDDLVAALFLHDAAAAGSLVRNALDWMARHRGARVPEVAVADPLAELRRATAGLRAFLDGAPCREEDTTAIADELEVLLATAYSGGKTEAEALLGTLTLKAPACCATKDGWKAYQKKGKWQAAAKASRSKIGADMLFEQAAECYAVCVTAHAAAKAYAAGRILHLLAGELNEVLAHFAERKRGAALIDFDDLLEGARDLLAGQSAVRNALAARYAHVLVDEFQDTDPLQSEILWRLCTAHPDPAVPWQDWKLRPGALFLVGDPKQAIYRFRGADVASYVAARNRLHRADATSCIAIGQNFRSVAPILDWVNARFEAVLSVENRQPGFSRLFTTVTATAGHPAVATLPVTVPDKPSAETLRDAEAEAVATFCARVIGALPVRTRDGARPCRPDDIALLAPAGTDLWRYERALEDAGIAVSTQAGKGFFRRQEVQDLLALTRILADAGDTLALGALLRGPLVGLTEEALLDATAALPPHGDGRFATLRVWTPLDQVADPLLRETLAILQTLARAARGTTPFVLLSQAAEELQVRPILRRRHDRTAERALANLDQFIEAARAYDTRGLLAFARAMTAQWRDAGRAMEGRPDTEQQAVSLVTMHSAKGLEWPVVVPINMGGRPGGSVEAALDNSGRLHMKVFGLTGPGTAEVLAAEHAEMERERHRLWYVATTRPRDLLLLPCFSTGVPNKSWQHCVGLDHAGLDEHDPATLVEAVLHRTQDAPNPQDRPRFEAESAVIAAQTRSLRRITPHRADAEEATPTGPTPQQPSSTVAPRPRGSQARGLVLHKLIEEVLTGETSDDALLLTRRATDLAFQLDAPGVDTLDPAELAATVLRTLSLPDVCLLRPRLVPECDVAASLDVDGTEEVTLGIADAVALGGDGRPELVVDWKSDVDPAPETVAHYRGQVRAYLRATGAREGLIVFVTGGRVERVLGHDRM